MIRRLALAGVAAVILFGLVSPAWAQESSTEKARIAGLWTGTALGLGMMAGTAYIQFGFEDEWTQAERILTYLPMAGFGFATSFLTTVAFFDVFLQASMHPVLAGLAGLGAGALEGALIGGSAFGAYLATATFLDRDYVRDSGSVYRSAWVGFRGGALFGAMSGAMPGAIVGIVLSLLPR